jgi:hypothetical protein
MISAASVAQRLELLCNRYLRKFKIRRCDSGSFVPFGLIVGELYRMEIAPFP